MAVYVIGSSRYKRLNFAESLQKKTACQLGTKSDLPYFFQFEQERLPLAELYALIDEQIAQCLQQADWQDLSNIPIFLGSTGYVIADCEARLLAEQPLPEQYSLAVIGNYISERYQCEVYSLATSCTSSAQGVYSATQMLEQSLCDKALVIGFEPFNRLTFEHFHSMHLLAEHENAGGIILGEGLGCLALSTAANPKFHCELLGVTTYTDFENLTNSSEIALQSLIEKILAKSAIGFEQISVVKPHAVGGNFDDTEKALLARYVPHAKLLNTKAELGHTLGASGVVETDWLLENLQKNSENQPLADNQYALCYFLGFGGSNVGWVLKW